MKSMPKQGQMLVQTMLQGPLDLAENASSQQQCVTSRHIAQTNGLARFHRNGGSWEIRATSVTVGLWPVAVPRRDDRRVRDAALL